MQKRGDYDWDGAQWVSGEGDDNLLLDLGGD